MNKLSNAQIKYFKETVSSFKLQPYAQWGDLWVYPPNPMCAKNLNFDAAQWERKPICMYSPADMWSIETLCARHGWEHSKYVKLEGWRQRLVKCVYDDFTIGSRKCVCSECRREHIAVKEKLAIAKGTRAPAAYIAELKQKLKALIFVFSTTNSMVIKCYMERYPWVATMMPAVCTHRSAISTKVLYMLQRSARTAQGSSDLEKQLTEFRGLVTATDRLSFYSLQRWHCTRASNHNKPSKIHHYEPGISCVSDTYLTFVLKQWYFNNVEEYMLQWFEQHCPIDICQSDHYCKRFARQRQDGTQLLTNRFTVMNTWAVCRLQCTLRPLHTRMKCW